MINIHIEYTDHVYPWYYELRSDVINIPSYGHVSWWRYAKTAEDAFRLAMEAKDQINFEFWQDFQLEFEF